MAPPVVLKMDVHCHQCAMKIRKAVENVRGVKRVWSSPEQRLVVVHGTADAWTLKRRIERKMERPVKIASDGSAPYHYSGTTTTQYGPSQPPAYGYYSQPPPHAYYSQIPPHAYYSQPPPPPPRAYYSDPDPYGYAAHSEVSACSIM